MFRKREQPTLQDLMADALAEVKFAEEQLRQADTLEALDAGHQAHREAWAAVLALIRRAKAERTAT